MEYGLLGEHITHSFSKAIHNLIDDYDYQLFDIPKDSFDDFMMKRDFKAINVTIPYKKDVLPYLNGCSDDVKRIGSANVIINKDGKLYGYNTDHLGLEYSIKKSNIDFFNKKVLILGSGGTSVMAEFVAQKLGAKEIIVISRTGENNYDNIEIHKDANIIINTTPVGMFPKNEGVVLSLKIFRDLCGVIDVIYNPLKTNLLIEAEALNIPCINGLLMLVAQAKYAAELFMNQTYDDAIIDRIYHQLKFQFTNIVLIGMSGCGKTTIVNMIEKDFNRECVDTDDLIVERCGLSIPEIFAQKGEAYFRQIEKEICREVSKKTGIIIATGGGLPISPENQHALMQNGYMIFVNRDVSKLDRRGRPLVKEVDALIQLFQQRLPIYTKLADEVLQNDGHINDTISNIKELIYENLGR